MRALRCAELRSLCRRALALLASILLAFEASSAQAGLSSLDPAFRLPAGGKAIAGPVLDSLTKPAAAWLLSEDLSLYALTEAGSLRSRVDLSMSAGAAGPGTLLALDPFGRVLVAPGGRELRAYSGMGELAWKAEIGSEAGEAAAFSPAFGSDGRVFALSGSGLICLNPAGLRLWELALPSPPSCPPGTDGRGYPCIGLVDGGLLLASPYGEVQRELALASPPKALLPLADGRDPSRPCLAVGLSDGGLLLLAPDGEKRASYRSSAAIVSLAWDGSLVYGLDAAGRAFAIGMDGNEAWTQATACLQGRLYLFSERLVAVGKGRAVSLSLDGELYRELSIPGSAGVPAVSPAGLAFSSGSDWILAAYRFERPLGQPRVADLLPYPDLPDIASRILLFDPLANDSSSQLSRLADIEKSMNSGSVGKDEPAAAAYCAAVATGALARGIPELERGRASNPLPRSRACYLLGCLGSPEYREPLFHVLAEDEDPAVRAAACEALAFMGVDGDGRSMAAFLAAAARPVDDRTALDIAAAIEGLALRSGAAPSEDGIRALVKLAATPYDQDVRARAAAALARISGFMK
jgi:hypothetical protein